MEIDNISIDPEPTPPSQQPSVLEREDYSSAEADELAKLMILAVAGKKHTGIVLKKLGTRLYSAWLNPQRFAGYVAIKDKAPYYINLLNSANDPRVYAGEQHDCIPLYAYQDIMYLTTKLRANVSDVLIEKYVELILKGIRREYPAWLPTADDKYDWLPKSTGV